MSSLSVLAPVLRRTRRLGQVVAMTAACSVLAAGAARAAEAHHPSRLPAACPQRSVLVACVDQDHQKMWVQEGSKVVFPAVTVRTGKPGLRTPDGLYRIYWRHSYVYSRLFDEPMPYSLFFFRGYALHATYDDVRKGGSHGCVNMRLDDARKVFGLMGVGDLVYIWGHKHTV
jgi:lipoprotein-anchoring transpeptidase ErfK/SrfK